MEMTQAEIVINLNTVVGTIARQLSACDGSQYAAAYIYMGI